MRMGYENASEILDVFPILEKYPIKNIAIHARIGKQLYKGTVDLDSFQRCLDVSKHKLYYNGDITSVEKFNSFGLTSENDILKYHVKEINKQNLSYMFEYLNGNHDFTIFIDLENVDFFQYEAAIELLMFLNSYRNKKSEYTIYIKNMNKINVINL